MIKTKNTYIKIQLKKGFSLVIIFLYYNDNLVLYSSNSNSYEFIFNNEPVYF